MPTGLWAPSTTRTTERFVSFNNASTSAAIVSALTVIGFFVSGSHAVALSYLVGLSYCTAIAIGMLLLVLIHHIFDASWSVVLRRQYEHAFAAFPWLFVLFLPLLVVEVIPLALAVGLGRRAAIAASVVS